MAAEDKLVDAAMGLRGASPEAWDIFVLAVRELAAGATSDMLRVTTTDQLLKQQGVAHGFTQLAGILLNAPKTYEARRQRNA